MNCVTCHGDSAADGSFKMPNPKLPVLPNSSDGFKQLAADKPAVMDFMKNEVKPKMAAHARHARMDPRDEDRIRLRGMPHDGRNDVFSARLPWHVPETRSRPACRNAVSAATCWT